MEMYEVKCNKSPLCFTLSTTGKSIALSIKEKVLLTKEEYDAPEVKRLLSKGELLFMKMFTDSGLEYNTYEDPSYTQSDYDSLSSERY